MSNSAVPPPVTRVTEAAGAWLPIRMEAVEGRLERALDGHGRMLDEAAGTTLDAGGKRLRPLLVLLSAGPDSGQAAARAASAVELVHMATLVHDDVLDAAPIRRGVPTIFARSGRELAVATGDLILSRAFAEIAIPGGERQVALLSSASVSLARGELAQRRDAFEISIPARSYYERCMLKTATLFECACVIGRAGPAAESIEEASLRAYGRQIGLAFQLLDDVLDLTGPSERTGKARGTDLLDGTVTLPLIIARDTDPGITAIDLRRLGAVEAESLCDRIIATGATERVRELARERVAEAKREIEKAGLDEEEVELLGLVADGVVERYA